MCEKFPHNIRSFENEENKDDLDSKIIFMFLESFCLPDFWSMVGEVKNK